MKQNIDNIPNDNSSLAADDGRNSFAEVGRATDSDGAVDAPDSEVDAIGSSTLGVELTGLSLVSSRETLLRVPSDFFAEFVAGITGGRMLSNTIVLSANAFLRHWSRPVQFT